MKMFLIIIASIFTLNASANDAAAPAIKVQGVDPMNSVDGTSFKVYGGNTNDLFEMIPSTMSVDPQQDIETAKNSRGIYIVSNGWTVAIQCAKRDGQGKALARGTECTFSLNKNAADAYNYDSETYDYAPSCSAVQTAK